MQSKEYKNYTIQQVVAWQEAKAKEWDLAIKDNPNLKGSNWVEGYKELMSFYSKDEFTLSSVDFLNGNPIVDYLKKHSDEYLLVGGSGFCIVTKKNK
jgi:hypothetical protein